MKVTLIQTKIIWQDADANLAHFENLIRRHEVQCDLFVLPEMFSTGFTMHPEEHSEPAESRCLEWMIKMAAEKKASITGSVAVDDGGKYFNRLYWVRADGTFDIYDKRHLFRMGGEHNHYIAGNKKLFVEQAGWLICPLVCYDLRFPVWSRNRYIKRDNHGRYEYDLLLYVANWPAVRSYAWRQLLIARAIENQCYVVGLNRTGKDGAGVDHNGHSMIIGPQGEVLLSGDENTEFVKTISLDKTALDTFRNRFPAGLDADAFDIRT